MSTDPNWLYSTIAQSSAAIVAIIGGFITASVLSLSAEKRSLINQKQDKEARLAYLKSEKEILSEERERDSCQSFIERISDELISADKIPSLDDLLKEHQEAQNLNQGTLRKDYDVFVNNLIQAKEFIQKHSNEIPLGGEFSDWVKTNKLDISRYDEDILESLFNNAQEKKQEALTDLQRLVLSPSLMRMRMPAIVPISTQNEWQKRRDTIQEYAGEITTLENDIKLLDYRVSKFSYPPNLGWGIVVLGFLAVFGILLPVIIISKEAFFDWAKLLTVITFWIGLIGVFAYIVLQIRTLKKR